MDSTTQQEKTNYSSSTTPFCPSHYSLNAELGRSRFPPRRHSESSMTSSSGMRKSRKSSSTFGSFDLSSSCIFRDVLAWISQPTSNANNLVDVQRRNVCSLSRSSLSIMLSSTHLEVIQYKMLVESTFCRRNHRVKCADDMIHARRTFKMTVTLLLKPAEMFWWRFCRVHEETYWYYLWNYQ
jgi:hypothetical protein